MPVRALDIHPHIFRHSFGIHLVRSGVDIRRVQLLLDHSNLNITQAYLQFRDGRPARRVQSRGVLITKDKDLRESVS